MQSHSYKPGPYQQFEVTDPKRRIISKASVRDRLLHQAIYQVLYSPFDRTFIYDSYSCRNGKGTHKAFGRLVGMARQVSRNYTGPCWGIKMDIRKFFDSIDHAILLDLLGERVEDQQLMRLLTDIIHSFSFSPGKGMPLGNLTSQLFANVYMDPLDKFVKHRLKAKYYLRYADDFILLSKNSDELMGFFIEINSFLKDRLKLNVHPHKITLRKLSQGLDFVGYVVLPHYEVPRRKTVRRMVKKVEIGDVHEVEKAMPSYLGYLQHAESFHTKRKLEGSRQILQDLMGSSDF